MIQIVIHRMFYLYFSLFQTQSQWWFILALKLITKIITDWTGVQENEINDQKRAKNIDQKVKEDMIVIHWIVHMIMIQVHHQIINGIKKEDGKIEINDLKKKEKETKNIKEERIKKEEKEDMNQVNLIQRAGVDQEVERGGRKRRGSIERGIRINIEIKRVKKIKRI